MPGALRVASLGMYDFPWLAAANDALWAAIAERLSAARVAGVPSRLDRSRALPAIWCDPALLLGQTCGLPLLQTLSDRVRVVATPCYDLPGCEGMWHRSFVVVRAAAAVQHVRDLRGLRCAINGRDSNTGMNLLRGTLAPLARGAPILGGVIETGAHLESLRAVREGRADFAAIDCVTHGFAARHQPALLAGTRVLAWTPPSPALPLVTGAMTGIAEQGRLRQCLADPALRPLWSAVGVAGLAWTGLDTYVPVQAVADAARAAGLAALG